MATTNVRGGQVKDGSIQRADLDVSTVGSAVIAKLIQGAGIALSSTGGDAGTGDVTITANVTTDQLVCETGAGSAVAGDLGEIKEASIASGSALAITSGTIRNITTISLTAGDWDLFGRAGCIGAAGTTLTYFAGGFSTANNTLVADDQFEYRTASFTIGTARINFAIPTRRISLSATTNYFLNVNATFAAATLSGYGYMGARRAR
jgi:hypothetical protein